MKLRFNSLQQAINGLILSTVYCKKKRHVFLHFSGFPTIVNICGTQTYEQQRCLFFFFSRGYILC